MVLAALDAGERLRARTNEPPNLRLARIACHECKGPC